MLEEKLASEGFDVAELGAKVHPRLLAVLESALEDTFTQGAAESSLRIDVRLQNFEKSAAHRRALETQAGLERRKSRVQAAQQRVFTEMQGLYGLDRFRLERRFESFYGFTANADTRAIAALAELDSVVEISLVERLETNDVEAISLTKAINVWGFGHLGQGVTIAVIDTGIDYTHGAFGGYSTFPNAKVIGGTDLANDDDDPMAECSDDSHGTGVASIAAGNGGGVIGAAPGASLVHVKIDDDCSNSWVGIGAAVDWIVSNHQTLGIDIVTLSMGWAAKYGDSCDSNLSNGLRDNLQTLYDLDIHFFAAAGNSADKAGIVSPSCSSRITSVGAVYDAGISSKSYCANSSCDTLLCTDEGISADLVTCYSNSADILDLLGPAECYVAAKVGGGTRNCFGGTSTASPFVAGVAATLLGAKPSLTREAMIFALKEGGKKVTDPANGLVKPRVNAWSSYIRSLRIGSWFVLGLNDAGQGEGEVLYRIDPMTTQTYDVADLTLDQNCASDLVQATDDGLFYAVGCEATGGGTSFFRVDPMNGEATDIATLWGDVTALTSLAFDATTQTLYGINLHQTYRGKVLVTIDRETGETTRVGSLWGDRTGATSIAFVSGQLYGINSSGWGMGKVLYEIDKLNAHTTDVGTLSGDHTRASSIRVAPDGTMYAIDWNGGQGGTGQYLFTIDVSDASTTEIGHLSGDRTTASALVFYQ
ncbi:MAG: S8 family serine peptidase [Acidobacteriota bacterium]